MNLRAWVFLLLLLLGLPALAGNLYLRFQLLSPVKAGVYADVMMYIHREPFFPGLRPLPPSGGGYPARWVKEGKFSPWTETGTGINPGENTVVFTFKSAEPVEKIDVAIEIASAPNPEAILTTIKGTTDGDLFAFLMPGELKAGQVLLTVADRTREHLETARKAFPDAPPTLKHITIDTNVGGFAPVGTGRGGVYHDPQLYRDELETLRRYGFNTLSAPPELFDPYGLDAGFTHMSQDYGPPLAEVFKPDYADKVAAQAAKWHELFAKNPALKARVFNIRLADEPGMMGGDWAENPEANAAFRDYLKARGFTPADFGLNGWDEVRLVISRTQIGEIERLWSDRQAKAAPMLYYHSTKFRSYTTWMAFKAATDAYRKDIDPAILTAINPSPHPLLGGGMLSSGSLDWIEGGRLGAVTMPWTEDWLGVTGWVAPSVEHVAFLADLLRAAGRYHQSPLGMYLIPVGCNSYLATTQKTYAALGRGATHLNYFLYGPYYSATWDFYSENYQDLKAIGDVARKLVPVEADLAQAKYRAPRVAILWPTSAEVWQDTTLYQAERQLLWLLLDRRQIPVDFIEEEDLEAGLPAQYQAIFVVGDCLTRKASAQLNAWVRNGGQLWLAPGAGLYDEYRRDNPVMAGLTGFRADALRAPKTFGGWGSVVMQKTDPLTTAKATDPAVPALPVLAARQDFTTAGEVLATFADGKPALAKTPVGKGQVWQAGFLLGLAYGAGSNKRDNDGYATAFPEDYGAWLAPFFAAANVSRPVTVSVPGVQTSLLDTPKKTVLVLTDFTRDPKRTTPTIVSLLLPGASKATKVTAASGTKVTLARKGADLELTLALDIGEVLVVE